MRLSFTLPVLLLGIGCQTGARFTPRDAAQARPATAPSGPGVVAGRPAPVEPVAAAGSRAPAPAAANPGSTQGAAIVQTSCSKGPAPGPGPCQAPEMVPTRVQTTTTYGRHCALNMDYLSLSLPFPHLRVYSGPSKVVTQTEFAPAPPMCCQAVPPAPAPAPGTTPTSGTAPASSSRPATLPGSQPSLLPEEVLPPIRR